MILLVFQAFIPFASSTELQETYNQICIQGMKEYVQRAFSCFFLVLLNYFTISKRGGVALQLKIAN